MHSHIVAPDDIQPQHHLLHAPREAVHPLVTLVQDQVDVLVEALQRALDIILNIFLIIFHR